MAAAGQDEAGKAGKVSRRNFVIGVGAGAIVAAVAVAGAESLLKGKSTPTVVTSTVPGPTSTVPGPTSTVVSTVTSTAPGPTSTETSTVTTTVTGTVTGTAAATGFPIVMVTNVSQLTNNSPVNFNYPLADEASILVKLGQAAQGGVGSNGDIVAFSTICQHAGCSIQYLAQNASPSCNSSYKAPGPVGYCCCHGSIYDFVNGAKVLSGPAPNPLPQVMLEVDPSGDIYAYAMGPPTIYGHNTGSSYVSDDLQG